MIIFEKILQENLIDMKEILDLIKTENHVKDNKLDFVSLCSSILSVKAMFNSALENGKVAIQSPGINTRTFTRNKGNYFCYICILIYYIMIYNFDW